MRKKQTLRVWIIALTTSAVALAASLGVPGCGGGQQSEGLADISSVTTTGITDTGRGAAVFDDIARAAPSMPVYGPTEMPIGITVPSDWWPVLDLLSPETYEGPAVANPRVLEGDSGDAEAQVVLQADDGWLVVLENFRGDLGEVMGEPVGEVDGHTATLYDLNGGWLVQWSDAGRWYGVYGRGVAEDSVVALALSMEVLGRPQEQ